MTFDLFTEEVQELIYFIVLSLVFKVLETKWIKGTVLLYAQNKSLCGPFISVI